MNARRARLIRRLDAWASCRPRYRVKIGDTRIRFDALTDEALDGLANEIAADVRRERARSRQAYARAA